MNSGISSGLGSENVDSIFSSGSSNSLRAEIFYSLVRSKMIYFERFEEGRYLVILRSTAISAKIGSIWKEVILFTTITTDDFKKCRHWRPYP